MTKSMNFPTVFIDACSTYFSKCNDDYEILIFMTNQRKKKTTRNNVYANQTAAATTT
jgi:hypothetical protein